MAMVVYGAVVMPAPAPGPAVAASLPPRSPAAAAAEVPTLNASPPVRIVIERLGIDARILRLEIVFKGDHAMRDHAGHGASS
ncbi:hypothetical protein NGM36_02990 [Streptomyces mutabilis]|uniref:hypothetical protein n=1 Tax=Streptomyces mutabilis TaxID=67332 RepID=UPI0022BA6FE7|nr:hypothetical protein [Streptomyces mutabilis]MCZ9348774.1 hypothetical protein [Streptomyces mutabilis]